MKLEKKNINLEKANKTKKQQYDIARQSIVKALVLLT